MIRLAVSVEGPTEEEFVKTVLLDHLRPMDVAIQPVPIGRARNADQGGGNVTIDRLAFDMASLYQSFDAVTSLVDFYGFRDKEDKTVQGLETHLHDPQGQPRRRAVAYPRKRGSSAGSWDAGRARIRDSNW